MVGLLEWRHVDPDVVRPRSGYLLDLVTTALGVWFTVGLFLDAWAHNNIPELESFLTPWHAVFYSGFAATGGWILWAVWRQVQVGRRGLAAVPVGYGLAVLALPLFALAGAGDYLWHTVLGIEQNLTILFSPTHLILITSMFCILTSPLRAAWADPDLPHAPSLRRLLPAVLSTAFSTTLVLLFLQYGNALTAPARTIVDAFSFPAHQAAPVETRWRTAGLVLTAVLLLMPLLLLARRWRLPFGTATILHLSVAALSGAIAQFANLTTVLGAVAAGVAVDLLAVWLAPTAARRRAYWTFAGLAPLATWSLYFAVAAAAAGKLPTVPEVWTGAPIVTALLGLLLAAILVPPAIPGAAPAPTSQAARSATP